MGAGCTQILQHVIFPHMVPSFFTGLRLGMTGVLLGVLLAELYVSTAGIGYFTSTFTPEPPAGQADRPRFDAGADRRRSQRPSSAAPKRITGGGAPDTSESKRVQMSKLKLTVACGDYDIVRPLKEGAVKAEGLDLIFLSDMGPRERHWRMGRKHEFDVCEENVGAYFMIRDQGEPLTAIPVFLHRRFRHGFVFVNTAAGIKSPKDLNGKVVGGTNFQPAASIWMRGILEEHYGLQHRSITWLVDRSEDIAFTPPPGLRIEIEEIRQAAEQHARRRRHPGDDLADVAAAFRRGRQAHRAAVS